MIAKLFRRLTADPGVGTALFDWATRVAREADWYQTGAVPDTIDGRFATLASVAALACLRLEQLGAEGERLSIALTERFAEVMESEHRELGLGDPSLGKTVLRLVGGLERRIAILRPAMGGTAAWADAAGEALPGADGPFEVGAWRGARLEQLADGLGRASLQDMANGEIA